MCDAVLTLGTAAYLLDDARYAARAVRIVQTWFLLPKTRMDPNMGHAGTIPGRGGCGIRRPAAAFPKAGR